ncbi:MAG: hypothetical protein ACJAU0_000812 [Flavobacteriales bacterium]|jgi:hypothetical protein
MTPFLINHPVTRAFLSEMQYADADVLETSFAQRARSRKLFTAISLESLKAQEVVLWIEAKNSCFPISTRITAIGDRMIHLEKNVRIPIRSICQVQLQS